MIYNQLKAALLAHLKQNQALLDKKKQQKKNVYNIRETAVKK